MEPDTRALQERISSAEALRARDEPTVPSELALEHATNPFLRCGEPALRDSLLAQGKAGQGSDADIFAVVRAWKDNF